MKVGIQQLHVRCNIAGASHGSVSAQVRMDRIAASDLPQALEDTLTHLMGIDPTVYVIRNIEQTTWLGNASDGDGRLAGRWGRSLADGVMDVLAARRAEEVVCFADEASFVARFLDDLLRDTAWEHWYYFPFTHLRRAERSQTVAAVLQTHASQLSALAAHLYRAGSLELLLETLGDEPVPLHQLRGTTPGTDARPLFAAAISLVGQMGLWRAGPPDLSLVDAYLATHELRVDWQDPHSLTTTVAEMVRFLAARGYVRALEAGDRDTAAQRVDRGISRELDWLDLDLLRHLITEVLQGISPVVWEGQPSAMMQRLFSLALRLAGQLGQWSSARPGPDVLNHYLVERSTAVEERDEAAPALVITGMIRFFAERGLIRFPKRDETTAAAKLSVALSTLDFSEVGKLDEHMLQRSLLTILADEIPLAATPPSSLSLAPKGGFSLQALSPRRRRLLEDLLAALRQTRMEETGKKSLRLDANQPESPANLLRLLAVLLDHAPQWSDDDLVYTTVRRLLALWDQQKLAAARVNPGNPPQRRAAPQENELTSALLAELDASAGGERSVAWGSGAGMVSPVLGVALLWRAVRDANLSTLFAGVASFPALLLGLALRWAGATEPESDGIDPALRMLCGPQAEEELPTREALRAAIQPTTFSTEWQGRWLRLLIGLRLLSPQRLHIYGLPLGKREALIAGDGSGRLWPLGAAPDDREASRAIIAGWWALWREVVDPAPVIMCDPAIRDFLPDGVTYHISGETDLAQTEAHEAGRARLSASLTALEKGRLGRVDVDLPLALVAIALLRLWARWLRGFADSSVPYLLNNLVRRQGRLWSGNNAWLIELERQPLDVVLEMVGYLAPLERVSWLDGQRVDFRLVDGP